jgi:urea transporter
MSLKAFSGLGLHKLSDESDSADAGLYGVRKFILTALRLTIIFHRRYICP